MMPIKRSATIIGIVFGFIAICWATLPAHYCGLHCGIKWWTALQHMSDLQHGILEAAEACRQNPSLVKELDFEDICDLNYGVERDILNAYDL